MASTRRAVLRTSGRTRRSSYSLASRLHPRLQTYGSTQQLTLRATRDMCGDQLLGNTVMSDASPGRVVHPGFLSLLALLGRGPMRRSSGDGHTGSLARQSHLVGDRGAVRGLTTKRRVPLHTQQYRAPRPPIQRFSQTPPCRLVRVRCFFVRAIFFTSVVCSRIKKPVSKTAQLLCKRLVHFVSSFVVVARTVARTVAHLALKRQPRHEHRCRTSPQSF